MSGAEDQQVWAAVVQSTGLSIPEAGREPFQALAGDIQALMGQLRGTGLGETPPGFAFHAL
ncbi:hypothetical protein E7744_06995 [Citricoccus sp. SGAir0253]|uniref:hypothetical protein n=1 Tax=Citricoccus sp. SGAir0253 TaxID=2567881 RepID=UPI0010CCB549|nr:hypothetical protein [Citricoccus sp. SGAir0253]QCU77958.1 hypothetical protein E7744_06995 [Citricoccus sp. SGAir0253]